MLLLLLCHTDIANHSTTNNDPPNLLRWSCVLPIHDGVGRFDIIIIDDAVSDGLSEDNGVSSRKRRRGRFDNITTDDAVFEMCRRRIMGYPRGSVDEGDSIILVSIMRCLRCVM